MSKRHSLTQLQRADILSDVWWISLNDGRLDSQENTFLLHLVTSFTTPVDRREIMDLVAAKLNVKFSDAREAFVRTFDPVGLRSLGHLLCYEFKLDGDTLIDTLMFQRPCHPVKVLGLDVGTLLSMMAGLGWGGAQRCQLHCQVIRRAWRTYGMWMEFWFVAGAHVRTSLPSLLTLVALKLAKIVARVGAFRFFSLTLLRTLNYIHGQASLDPTRGSNAIKLALSSFLLSLLSPLQYFIRWRYRKNTSAGRRSTIEVCIRFCVVAFFFYYAKLLIARFNAVMEPRRPLLHARMQRRALEMDYLIAGEDIPISNDSGFRESFLDSDTALLTGLADTIDDATSDVIGGFASDWTNLAGKEAEY